MGILVKGEITITKGFKTWKEMVYAQDEKDGTNTKIRLLEYE